MKYYNFTAALLLLLTSAVFAQAKDEEKVTVTFGGYVRTDVVFDSRQNESTKEGYFLRYPKPEVLDKNGDDLNAKASLGIFSIHSRLSAKVTGPQILGAKTSALVETDFFGVSDATLNAMRMRHFYMEFKWASSSLLLGQYWHPLVVPDAAPTTVGTNTGSPFQVFARAPQIKFTQNFSDLALIFAIASQRDYASDGPAGTSPLYLKNAIIPELNLIFQYKFGDNLAGIGGNFKSLMPRTQTSKGISTDERINSMAAIGFIKLASKEFSVSAKAIYGQNMSNYSMLGGYAVKSSDAVTGEETYTNINTLSGWVDMLYGKDVKVGLFAGYTKNLGSNDEIVGAIYGRGKDIDNLFRLSPRLLWNISKARLATELDYTAAAYGTADNKGKVKDTKTVGNLRLMVSAYYFF